MTIRAAPDAMPHAPFSRSRALRRVCGGLSAALVVVSTLHIGTFDPTLALRGLLLGAGLVLATPFLAGLVPGRAPTGESARRLVAAVFVVNALATLYAIPIHVLASSRPIVTDDYAVHYVQCERARSELRHSFRVAGYSPWFMAGYPAGTIFDVDMKGAELFCTLLPMPTALALKVFVFGVFLLMVLGFYHGSRLLGFGAGENVLGLLLFLVYWHWGRPYAGDFRYVGMFSFVAACYLSLLLAGLLRAFLLGSHGRTFFVLGAVTFLLHAATLVLVAAPFLALLVVHRRSIHRRQIERLILWALVVLLANVLWLKPVIEFLPDKLPTTAYYQTRGALAVAHLLLRPTSAPALALLVLAVLGAWRQSRRGLAAQAAPLVAGAVFLMLCAAYGVFVPGLNQMEPGRFLFGAIVFAAPLAGSGLAWMFDRLPAAARGAALRRAALVALVLLPLPLALLEAKAFYRHTVGVALTPAVERLRQAIRATVHPGARLMIEDANAAVFGGTYFPVLLPHETGVEQIGGPYPHTPLRHARTEFTSDRLLGRPLADWDPAALRTRLAFLRVRWIVTATPAAARLVASVPGVSRVWNEPPFSIWVLDAGEPAEPRTTASLDRIEVTFDAPSRGAFIPYHWVRGLRASPPAEIVPALHDDDPVPYIYIRPHGANRVLIRYRK